MQLALRATCPDRLVDAHLRDLVLGAATHVAEVG
jgi:hypothetical protein